MMFTAGFDMNDPVGWQVVNEWNETMVYSRAFINDDGDAYGQMPVPNGISLDAGEVSRIVSIWESAVTKFTDEIGFNRPEDDPAPAAPSQPVASGQPTPPPVSQRVGPKKAAGSTGLGSEAQ